MRSWAALLLALIPGAALGAEVQPAFLEKDLRPGFADTFKITLRTGLATETVWIQPVDYSLDRLGQVSTAPLKNVRYSGRAWCRLRPTRILLRKGRDEVVEIRMLAPSGTAGGEYYFGILVSGLAYKVEKGGATVQVEVNMVVLVIVTIKGGTPRVAGELLDSRVAVRDNIPSFRATFHNTGTVSVISRMAAVIRDSDRNVIDKFMMKAISSPQPDGQAFVMPAGMRDFEGEGNRKLPAGRYTVNLFSVYGPKSQRVSETLEFSVGEPTAVKPIDDVLVTPPKIVAEIASGATHYELLEIKNRGLAPIDLRFSSAFAAVSPDVLRLEPGKMLKVRVTLRVPATEDPRRDVTVEFTDGKDRRSVAIAVYAPGTAPKEEK